MAITNENPAAASRPPAGLIGNAFDVDDHTSGVRAEQDGSGAASVAAGLARRHRLPGFRVKSDVKEPAYKGWQQEATADPEALAKLLAGRPAWGVKTGDGLLVIDFDSAEALLEFDIRYRDLPPTFTVKTRRGLHVYLRVPRDYKSTRQWLGLKIDLRCKGGLVIGAGSKIGESVYVVNDDLPIADAPDWLLELFEEHKPTEKMADLEIGEAQLGQSVGQYMDILQEREPAIEGSHGDDWTYKTIALGRDLAIPAVMNYQLVSRLFNPRCIPQWNESDLWKKVESVYRTASGQMGAAVPQFPAVIDAPEVVQAEPQLQLPEVSAFRTDETLDFEDAEDIDNGPPPVIAGLINKGEVGFVVAVHGAGKSSVVSLASGCVASGQPFGNASTEQGGVLYVMGEGHGGARKRKRALQQRFGDRRLPLRFVLTNLNLLKKEGAERILRHCESFKDAFGDLPSLIVLDTMAALAPGMSENDADQATLFMHRVRQLATVTGAAVLLIAHEGKDTTRGLRGSSAFLGAADFVLRLDKSKRTIAAEKLREDEIPPPMGYELVSVEVGRRRNGTTIKSVLANMLARPKPNLEAIEAGLRSDQRDLMQVIRALAAEQPPTSKGLTIEQIAREATAHGVIEAATEKDGIDSARGRVKRLEKTGLLVATRNEWFLAGDVPAEQEA